MCNENGGIDLLLSVEVAGGSTDGAAASIFGFDFFLFSAVVALPRLRDQS